MCKCMTCEWCVAMGNGLFCLGFGGFLESQNAVFHSIDLVTVFGEAFVVGNHDGSFVVLLGFGGRGALRLRRLFWCCRQWM